MSVSGCLSTSFASFDLIKLSNCCFFELKSCVAFSLAASINFCKSCVAFLISFVALTIWSVVDEASTLLFCNDWFALDVSTFWPSCELIKSSNCFLASLKSLRRLSFLSLIFLVNDSIASSIVFVFDSMSLIKSLLVRFVLLNMSVSGCLSTSLASFDLIKLSNLDFDLLNFSFNLSILSSCSYCLLLNLLFSDVATKVAVVARAIINEVESKILNFDFFIYPLFLFFPYFLYKNL